MEFFLKLVFIFYLGSTAGWVIELIFRRIVHKKWVNPGFLIGPYLPIYGFGLVLLTTLYLGSKDMSANPVIIILLMGVAMTLIELIGGEIGLKNNVRLWDYRDRWLNYKGLICPLFSAIWTAIGAVYYYFLAPYVMDALTWFSHNLIFSYVLGVFSGLIVIDFFHSGKYYAKIRKFAKENKIVVKYERLKMDIRDFQKRTREKYSFFLPFKQTRPLEKYLSEYREKSAEKQKKK
ncbi:putative ABC transporter permease [Candidatus Saccharibacteria bacterium]|nr:putative ABC transporter permease [Candidatus Saccharibacteria bacterium]